MFAISPLKFQVIVTCDKVITKKLTTSGSCALRMIIIMSIINVTYNNPYDFLFLCLGNTLLFISASNYVVWN